MCKLVFHAEKATKNTIKFKEVKSGRLADPAMITSYLQKGALNTLGWEDGREIIFEVKVGDMVAPKIGVGKVAPKGASKKAPKAPAKKAAKGAAKKAPKASK